MRGAAWGKGKVRLGPFSSFRKFMRAARRGLLPPEQLGIIDRAVKSVARHPQKFKARGRHV